jgi:hypothetical protein
MATTGGLALSTTHRMVNRVLRRTTVVRTTIEPPAPPGFADVDVLMLRVTHFTDSRVALEENPAHLT